MKTLDILARAGKNLRQAKVRTFLTSAAIAIGAFAISISAMAGEGMRQYTTKIMESSVNPKTIFISAKPDENQQDSFGWSEIREYKEEEARTGNEFYSTKMLTLDDMKNLQKRDDIENLSPRYSASPKFVEFENIPGKRYVTFTDTHDKNRALKVADGKSFAVNEKMKIDEAILPESFLKTLNKNADEMIGEKVILTFEKTPQPSAEDLKKATASGDWTKFNEMTKTRTEIREVKIVGVAKRTAEQQLSPSALTISEDLAREMEDFLNEGTPLYQKYGSFSAIVKDGSKIDEVQRAISDAGYQVNTAKEAENAIQQVVNVLQGITSGFGLLALLVSIFGIVNTMYISVLERTQQIGLMKALGASRRDIGRLFRLEAGWVGFLGAILGVGGAILAGIIGNPIIANFLQLDGVKMLIAVPWQIAGIVGAIVLVAILSGWLPSRKAAKLDPIEALRTE